MTGTKKRRGRRRLPASAKRTEELRLYLTPGEMRMIVASADRIREDYRTWALRSLLDAASVR